MAETGLFQKKQEVKQEETKPDFTEYSRRLRVLEERNSNLDKKLQLVEQNMLNSTRKLNSEMKQLTTEMADLKHDVEATKNKMLMMIKELQLMAREEDLTVLKRYMEYWQPGQFLTKKQAVKMFEDFKEEQEPIK